MGPTEDTRRVSAVELKLDRSEQHRGKEHGESRKPGYNDHHGMGEEVGCGEPRQGKNRGVNVHRDTTEVDSRDQHQGKKRRREDNHPLGRGNEVYDRERHRGKERQETHKLGHSDHYGRGRAVGGGEWRQDKNWGENLHHDSTDVDSRDQHQGKKRRREDDHHNGRGNEYNREWYRGNECQENHKLGRSDHYGRGKGVHGGEWRQDKNWGENSHRNSPDVDSSNHHQGKKRMREDDHHGRGHEGHRSDRQQRKEHGEKHKPTKYDHFGRGVEVGGSEQYQDKNMEGNVHRSSREVVDSGEQQQAKKPSNENAHYDRRGEKKTGSGQLHQRGGSKRKEDSHYGRGKEMCSSDWQQVKEHDEKLKQAKNDHFGRGVGVGGSEQCQDKNMGGNVHRSSREVVDSGEQQQVKKSRKEVDAHNDRRDEKKTGSGQLDQEKDDKDKQRKEEKGKSNFKSRYIDVYQEKGEDSDSSDSCTLTDIETSFKHEGRVMNTRFKVARDCLKDDDKSNCMRRKRRRKKKQ